MLLSARPICKNHSILKINNKLQQTKLTQVTVKLATRQSVRLRVLSVISVLDFPLLAAGMTRGNMPGRLHYPGLLDPAWLSPKGAWLGTQMFLEKEGRVGG